jgi:hypothetical protein
MKGIGRFARMLGRIAVIGAIGGVALLLLDALLVPEEDPRQV